MKSNYLIIVLLLLMVGCQGGSRADKATSSQEVNLTEITFSVGGMTCAMCEASIERGVGQLAGIDSIKAVMGDSIAFVRFNAKLISADEISKTIESRGYKVKGIRQLTD